MASLARTAKGQPRLPQRPDSEGGDLSAEREGGKGGRAEPFSQSWGRCVCVCGGNLQAARNREVGTAAYVCMCVCVGGSLGNLAMWLVQPS